MVAGNGVCEEKDVVGCGQPQLDKDNRSFC